MVEWVDVITSQLKDSFIRSISNQLPTQLNYCDERLSANDVARDRDRLSLLVGDFFQLLCSGVT